MRKLTNRQVLKLEKEVAKRKNELVHIKLKDKNPGYHLDLIEKGKVGELSKIQEELDEAKDAERQQCKIMLAVELSDLIGAVEIYANQKLNMTLDDLIKMNNITQRAFKNGRR